MPTSRSSLRRRPTPRQKEAYRAADLALPQLKPGKSLTVRAAAAGGPCRPRALRRAGRDRGGDRGAADLSDFSASRDGRRAAAWPPRNGAKALEARIGENAANTESRRVVRRYYRQDSRNGCSRMFGAEGAADFRPGPARRRITRRFTAPPRWCRGRPGPPAPGKQGLTGPTHLPLGAYQGQARKLPQARSCAASAA